MAAELPPDATLIRTLKRGDEAAFRQLVDAYHGQLLRLARFYVKSDADAAEVVQDTWVGMLRGLKNFEGRSSLKTWLFRILTNRAKSTGVRQLRNVPMSDLGEDTAGLEEKFTAEGRWMFSPEHWEFGPERTALVSELREVLKASIDDLPEPQGLVVYLKDVQGLENEEITDLLGITSANMRVILHRGRKKLRAVLQKYLEAEQRSQKKGRATC